jgi:transcriptional regulator with XRE-family HTH domain
MDLQHVDGKKAVAENLARLLAEKGWTQKKLADEADLSPGLISGILKAEKFPIYETLDAICKALKCEHTAVISHPELLRLFKAQEKLKKDFK